MRGARGWVIAAALTTAACTGLLGDFDLAGTTPGEDGGIDANAPPTDGGAGDANLGDAAASADASADGAYDAAPACTADVCSCPAPGTTLCDGACVTLASDNAHCGTTCANAIACVPPDVCQRGACAACPAPTTNCGGTCADTTKDGSNCGACGHACGGGMCTNGVCQPVQIGQLAGSLPTMVVWNGSVYGTFNDGSGSGQIYRLPADAGPSKAVPPIVSKVGSAVRALFANADGLWFASAQTPAAIYVAKYTDLGNPVVASNTYGGGNVYNLAALGGHPYWDQGTGSIFQNLNGPTATPVSITPSTTRAIGADGTRVFWAKSGGAIYAGFGDLTVAANNAQIATAPSSGAFDRLAIDATAVYFGDGSGLWHTPKSGSPPTIPMYFQYSPVGVPPQVLAVDPESAGRVYFTAVSTPATGTDPAQMYRQIYAFPKDYSAKPVAIVTTADTTGVVGMAAGALALYWTTFDGGIWKLVR